MATAAGVGDDPLVQDPALLPDADLLVLVRDGSAAAWEEIVDRYQTLTYSAALAAELRPEEAVDATQSAFLALLESRTALRSDDCVASWLVTVVRRQAWRVRRVRDRELPVAELAAERDRAVPAPSVDWDVQISLHDALQRLGSPCRDLLEALYFDPAEPSYSEIARRLGRAVGSIGPLRGRCLERLRRLMGDAQWQ